MCLLQIVNVIYYSKMGSFLVDEYQFILILMLYGFLFYAHFCVCVSLHIAKLLNIGIFTIMAKPKAYGELPPVGGGDIELK